MVSKIDRHSIANHLITIVYVIVDELEIVRETLDSSDFTNSHPSIFLLVARSEDLKVLFHLNHLWSIRVQLSLPTACLNSETRFIPTPDPITRHKNCGVLTNEIFVIRESTLVSVSLILRQSRNRGIFQVPDTFTKSRLMFEGCWILEIMNIKIFPETNIENTVPILSNIEIICIQHLQIHIVPNFVKQFQETLNCGGISSSKHSRNILCHKKQRLRFFEDSDIVVEQLTTFVLNSPEGASFAP